MKYINDWKLYKYLTHKGERRIPTTFVTKDLTLGCWCYINWCLTRCPVQPSLGEETEKNREGDNSLQE